MFLLWNTGKIYIFHLLLMICDDCLLLFHVDQMHHITCDETIFYRPSKYSPERSAHHWQHSCWQQSRGTFWHQNKIVSCQITSTIGFTLLTCLFFYVFSAEESMNSILQANFTNFKNEDTDYPTINSIKKTGFMPTPRPTIASQSIIVAREKAAEKVLFFTSLCFLSHILLSLPLYLTGCSEAFHHEAVSECQGQDGADVIWT